MEDASPGSATDPSLVHLLAELARVDLLVRRAVRQWQRAGQNPADRYRGLCLTDEQANALVARPFASNWGHVVDDSGEDAFAAELAAAADRAARCAELAFQNQVVPRLLYLAAAFGLSAFDVDALLICLAPALDLRYEWLYGYLQDDVTRKAPGVSLILDLLCPEWGADRLVTLLRFLDDSPLLRHKLIRLVPEASTGSPLPGRAFAVDRGVLAWLLGAYELPPALAGRVELSWGEDAESTFLAGSHATELDSLARLEGALAVFHGADLASQHAAAAGLAARLRAPLFTLALAPDLPPDTLSLALRDAQLTGALPYLKGWDVFLEKSGAEAEVRQTELLSFPRPLVVATRSAWQPSADRHGRPVLLLEFPLPGRGRRQQLWQHYISSFASASALCAAGSRSCEVLASRFQLASAQIRDAVLASCDRARLQGRALQESDLVDAIRSAADSTLGALARKITPRYDWADLILPDDQLALLREIVDAVRKQVVVLDEWGFGRKLVPSRGMAVLFAGPPGTGKTMAAEVMARQLDLDLYKIDLSTVVSKYIGETEKNLEQIFRAAENSNAILFFDEADAIFGKRSEVRDAHDRYANIEISYLLQRMEMYDGLTILATNLRANLDEAFTRRLQFAVDFPFPEQEYRRRIWDALFPVEVRGADVDIDLLARRFKLAGGSIRNAIVTAAYLAAPETNGHGANVGMDDLLRGVRRELQKIGRLVNEQDLVG